MVSVVAVGCWLFFGRCSLFVGLFSEPKKIPTPEATWGHEKSRFRTAAI
jgi:hypothetical protein